MTWTCSPMRKKPEIAKMSKPIDDIKEQLTKLFDSTEDDDLEQFYSDLDELKDHVDDLMSEVDIRIDEIQNEDQDEDEEA